MPITDPTAPALPTLPSNAPSRAPTPSPPALTAPAPLADLVSAIEEAEPPDPQPEHPMAHLMPQRIKPTEASLRAAAQRAARKKKAKRIKIGVLAGFLAIAAIAGPPLGGWLMNAINESGSTKTEQPADRQSVLDTIDADAIP